MSVDFVVDVVAQAALLSKLDKLSEPFYWNDGEDGKDTMPPVEGTAAVNFVKAELSNSQRVCC